MTRIRAYLLATLAGILITAGGCADSATAPTAVAAPSLNRAVGDSVSAVHRPPAAGEGQQKTGDGGEITIQSGYLGAGS
jgi:hypothetical protein